MGEAKAKDIKRRIHARKIVAAFEDFITAIIKQEEGEKHFAREALVDILVTPPPK